MSVGLMRKVLFQHYIFQTTICFIKLVDVLTYVHNSFRSEEVVINRIATGWEHLTINFHIALTILKHIQ